jgi:hypothetical protein
MSLIGPRNYCAATSLEPEILPPTLNRVIFIRKSTILLDPKSVRVSRHFNKTVFTMSRKINTFVDDLRKKHHGHLTEATPGGKEKPKAGVKEVVMLQCSSVAGDPFMLTADIVRTEGAKYTVS